VLLYNRARFEDLGIQVPETWEEFARVAAEVRRQDPDTYLATFSPAEFGGMAAMAQQAGAQWWQVEDRAWTIGIDDEPTRRVAAYWQNLIGRDLVEAAPLLTPEWNNHVNRGEVLTWPAGVWSPGVIHGIAPDQDGDWAIAPLPRWEGGDQGVPLQGGSALTVTSPDEVEAAVEFITWMNTSEEACTLQTAEGQYPASRTGQALTSESPPPPLTAGQEDYWEVANEAARNVLPNIQWGPNVNTAATEYMDAASQAIREDTSLVDAIERTQEAVVGEMERVGFDITN
jgi:multiple sugar transport system substrate-binding protein